MSDEEREARRLKRLRDPEVAARIAEIQKDNRSGRGGPVVTESELPDFLANNPRTLYGATDIPPLESARDRLEALEAENKRLRAALTLIAELSQSVNPANVARKALNPETQS